MEAIRSRRRLDGPRRRDVGDVSRPGALNANGHDKTTSISVEWLYIPEDRQNSEDAEKARVVKHTEGWSALTEMRLFANPAGQATIGIGMRLGLLSCLSLHLVFV